MGIQRATKEGLKLWIAPKIHGLGPNGPQDGQILVVSLDDHQEALRGFREALVHAKVLIDGWWQGAEDITAKHINAVRKELDAALKGGGDYSDRARIVADLMTQPGRNTDRPAKTRDSGSGGRTRQGHA